MPFDFDMYVSLIYFLAAIPYAWMGLYAWRKRPAVAVTPFAWLMLCMSIWTLAYGLEIALPTLPLKLTAVGVEFIGIVSVPVCLLFFSLEFTGKNHWLTARKRLLLWIVPLLTLILVWTNEHHHLMWNNEFVFQMNNIVSFTAEYNAFFGVFVAYSTALTLTAIFLLLAEMNQRPNDYRLQVNLIVLGVFAPLASVLLRVAKISVVGNLDITPLVALPASLGLSWAVTQRYRLLELLPLEYLSVLKNMKDEVIVTDNNQRVIYLNPAAETLLGRLETEAIGQPLNYVSKRYGEKLALYLKSGEQRTELTFGEGVQSKILEATASSVASLSASSSVNQSDRMIVLHDITHLKQTENALSRRETIMSALSLAAEQFLKESSWEHNIPGVLEKIGQAADVSRVLVAMNYTDEQRVIYSSLCYEWASVSASSQIRNPELQHIPLLKAGMSRWMKTLGRGDSIYGLVKNLPEDEREFFRKIGSLSIAVTPIFANKQWWGFIAFDECRHERLWNATELEALNIAASMFGSAETRARAEQKLIRRQQALDLLHEIVLDSLKAEDLIGMSKTLVKKFVALIHADGCALTLWDENNQQEIRLATQDRQERAQIALASSPAERTLTEFALNKGHTLVVEDANAAFYEDRHITKSIPSSPTILALPLIAGKKKLGAVLLWFDQPHHFQPEEISLSEQASNLVALALEKFITIEQAERRATVSETLRKASAAITEALETDEAVARILEQLKQVVNYASASVQLLNENQLTIIGGSGFADSQAVIGMSFHIPGNNPNSVVIQSGKPYLLSEIGEDYPMFKNPPHNHIHSWLGVPLIFQERIMGLLAIDSDQPNHFTEEDVNLTMIFANQVAVTLENARIFKESHEQAVTDALTGLYNRRGLFQIGDFELLRARRANRPFSLMMFDIDHFKRVNDHYGHAAGDQVLRGLAERCRFNSRAIDVVCRYGGEEFIVFLPEANLASARAIAERLRQTVMRAPIPTDPGPLRVTVSVGVAQANERDTLKTLIERADYAMYAAKRNGRNRVEINDGTQPLSQI